MAVRILLFLTFLLTNVTAMSQDNFKPERISKTASFIIHGKVKDVFPLFGPIREKEWAEGWDPEIVFSKNNLVEEHMIFRTKASTDENFYTWIITQFDPKNYRVEYTVSTKNRIWFIRVQCQPSGDATEATVSYTYTGLNAEGNELNRNALAKIYINDLKDWQEAINYYIHNGKMLTTH
jgi:hypothetical protein